MIGLLCLGQNLNVVHAIIDYILLKHLSNKCAGPTHSSLIVDENLKKQIIDLLYQKCADEINYDRSQYENIDDSIA